MTVALNRVIFALSVISRCNSNHNRSISAIVANFVLLPIDWANSPSHSPRPGSCDETIEPSNTPCVSPATCWRTPNNSLSDPRRFARISCFAAISCSFFSKIPSRRSASASSSRCIRLAFFSSLCCFALSAMNSRSRRSLTSPLTTLPSWTSLRSSASDFAGISSAAAFAYPENPRAKAIIIMIAFFMGYSPGADTGRWTRSAVWVFRAIRSPSRTPVLNSSGSMTH